MRTLRILPSFAFCTIAVVGAIAAIGTSTASPSPRGGPPAVRIQQPASNLFSRLPIWQQRKLLTQIYGPAKHYGTGINGRINYIVVIEMENRSVDDLLSGYYGLTFHSPGIRNGQPWQNVIDIVNPNSLPSPNSQNALSPLPLENTTDPEHSHGNFGVEFDYGLNDGWLNAGGVAPGGWNPAYTFSYVPISETTPYAQLIENYGFADHVYQSNEGPSFPAHQYLIAGQSGGLSGGVQPLTIAENSPHNNPDSTYPYDGPDDSPFCAGGDATRTIDMTSDFTTQYLNETSNTKEQPCYDSTYLTIFDQLAPVVTPPLYPFLWEYHAHSMFNLWAAPMAVRRFYNNGQPVSNFVVDPDAYKFVTTEASPTPIETPNLAAVTYLSPCVPESDHPGTSSSNGPQWVAWVIDAIGTNTALWKQTAIFVVWDDWGGWYDHELPFHPLSNPYGNNPSDPYEWGYRVPLMVISPYTQAGTVDKTARSQSSILDFIEYNFGAASLGADDTTGNNTDHLSSLFNVTGTPRPFVPISTTYSPSQRVQNGNCP